MDISLFGKIAGMIREYIPERIIFAKGTGAFGYFKPRTSFAEFTSASFLSEPLCVTPLFVRFSQMLGRSGSPDTMRTPRGMSIKLYTEQGIQDIIMSSCPFRLTDDPEKIPDMIEAIKGSNSSNIVDPSVFWRFVIQNPESFDAALWMFSDMGTMKSYVNLETYGVNKYIWRNVGGDEYYVRFRITPHAGVKTITRGEAEFLASYDPDASIRELNELLSAGKRVSYTLNAHITSALGNHETFKTQIRQRGTSRVINLGDIILNSVVDDHMSQCECAAFSPNNNVKGISLMNSRMTEIMTAAHEDSHRYRLGGNYTDIAVNKSADPGAKAKILRDFAENKELILNDRNEAELSFKDYDRMGFEYNLLHEDEKERLIENIIDNIRYMESDIKEGIAALLKSIDRESSDKLRYKLNL